MLREAARPPLVEPMQVAFSFGSGERQLDLKYSSFAADKSAKWEIPMTRKALMFAGIAIAYATSAGAHTTIWPRASLAGAIEKYTIRVPTEGQVMTTSAELDVPDGVTIQNIGVPQGWTYDLKRRDGRVVGVVWHVAIKPGEFGEFSFTARNPADKDQVVWGLRQVFADGKVTNFTTGPQGIDPTAVVKLSKPD